MFAHQPSTPPPTATGVRPKILALAGLGLTALTYALAPMLSHDRQDPSVTATLTTILEFRLDTVLFATMSMGSLLLAGAWIRSHWPDALPRHGLLIRGVIIAITIGVGAALAEVADRSQRAHMRALLSGYAPTYAEELARQGHARLPLDPRRTDPRYQYLLDAQSRWLAANPNIIEIYTVRRDAKGQLIYLVNSESDLNRDGMIQDLAERRIPPGEPVHAPPPELQLAMSGTPAFSDQPTIDDRGVRLRSFHPIRDASGTVEAALGVEFDAADFLMATATARAAALLVASLLSGAAVAGVLIHAQLRVRRLTQRHIAQARDELEARVRERTADLADANNALKAEIEQRRAAELEHEQVKDRFNDAARRAGMAEVATGVLHNVGNVLNSVNVSANTIVESVRNSKVQILDKLVDLLKEHERDLPAFLTADPRGRQIPALLTSLAGHLGSERSAMLVELDELTRHIDHIKQVVAMQQDYAKRGGVAESLDLAALVEDALKVEGPTLERNGIRVVRKLGRVPEFLADKHTILQILVNLISNARHSVIAAGQPEKAISVSLHHIDDAHGGRAVLQVIDTGVGISAENLPKIFGHGFTTRPNGHGFGLHTSANAAKQMGGSLTAHSNGVGRGAIFTLDLPLRQATAATATRAPAPPDRGNETTSPLLRSAA